PNFQINIWSAIFAPKGTPKPVLAKLNDALSKALDDPPVVKRLADLGGTVPAKVERGPQHLGEVLKADIARWDPILRQAMADAKKNKAAKRIEVMGTCKRKMGTGECDDRKYVSKNAGGRGALQSLPGPRDR